MAGERWDQLVEIFGMSASVDEYTGSGELGIYFDANVPVISFETYGGD